MSANRESLVEGRCSRFGDCWCDHCWPPEPELSVGDHVHVYSVFGRFCYRCFRRRRWWAFWEKWMEEEHDEPF